jgi:hypothetical protein
LSDEAERGSVSPSAAGRIAGQVVANTSLLIAVLVYMGWAYDAALYGYFHLNPLDLDVGVVEYMLRSLSLFSPDLVLVAVVIVAVAAVRPSGLGHGAFAPVMSKVTAWAAKLPVLGTLLSTSAAERPRASRLLLIRAGAAISIVALILVWAASYVAISTYLILALLAVVITAVCALWATSLYAQSVGTGDAQAFVRNLPSGTAVVVYSSQRLALSGPGVTVLQLQPGFLYRYEYAGFRLLTVRSGTYYVVPVGWNPRMDITYIFSESDQLRIELLSGVVRATS